MIKLLYIQKNVARILLFIALLIIFDQLLGSIIEKMYFAAPSKMTYSLEATDQDVLVFGSSRARRHYDCDVIEEHLGLSSFNNGQDGRNIFFHYIVLEATLRRHLPRCVILDITHSDVNRTAREWDTDLLSDFFPYCQRSRDIRDTVVHLRGGHERLFLLSKCYVYNSKLLAVLQRKLMDRDPHFGKNGFMPIKGEIDATILSKVSISEFETDERKLDYVDKFISACTDKGVSVIIMRSPSLSASSMDVVSDLCKRKNVEFWDYSNYSKLCKPEYFRDMGHMNERGAELFSKEIALRIKKMDGIRNP